MRGLYVMDLERFDDVYGPEERAAIEEHVDIIAPPLAKTGLTDDLLSECEVLVTSWGCPPLTPELLAAAPKLALVLYGAGSVRSVVTPDSWARGVRITSAGSAIGVSVAEFAFSQILLALKHTLRYVLDTSAAKAAQSRRDERGAYRSTVGLVSLGATGRATAELLARHDVVVQAYDPYVQLAGVRNVELEELFATSDVVSLHAPLLPETRAMVDETLLSSMKTDATLVNTARGGLIDENALVRVLTKRSDLFAMLDVTDPEPPVPESPLFALPNVALTPHLAGSLGVERRRQGRLMADELARYVAGQPLLHEVTETAMARTA